MFDMVMTAIGNILIFGTWIICGVWYLLEFCRYYTPRLNDSDTQKLHAYMVMHAIMLTVNIICSAMLTIPQNISGGIHFVLWFIDGIVLISFCVTLYKGLIYFDTACGNEPRTMRGYIDHLKGKGRQNN